MKTTLRNAGQFSALMLSAVMAVSLVSFGGCGGGTQSGTDENPGDVADDVPDVPQEPPKLTFINPVPGDRVLVSGTLACRVKYEDPLNRPATLTYTVLGQEGFVPVNVEAKTPGEYSFDIDTKTLADGNKSIGVSVLTDDSRKVSAKQKILVDNNGPTIEVLEPTPPEGGNFINDLVIRVRFTDLGNKIHTASIKVEDFEWTWPPNEDTAPVAELDTREGDLTGEGAYKDLKIRTVGWKGGDRTMTITANDGMKGHTTKVSYRVRFVEVPGFVGGEQQKLPDNTEASIIEGLRIGPIVDETWGVVVGDKNGVNVFVRKKFGIVEAVSVVSQRPADRMIVHRMDLDEYEDVVVAAREGTGSSISVNRQNADGTFSEFVAVPVEGAVLNMAAGDLNKDSIPDIAFVTDATVDSVGIILSQTDENDDLVTWGEATMYPGAVQPEQVTVGRFANIETNNAVAVGRRGQGIITVFPCNDDGVPSSGENSTLLADDRVLKGVSDLAATNFKVPGGEPDTLLFLNPDEAFIGVAKTTAGGRVLQRQTRTTGLDPEEMVVGDVTGDGNIDVVALCSGSNMVQVFHGASQTSATELKPEASTELLAGAAKDVTLADMDGDGYLDIVLLDSTGTALVSIMFHAETDRNRFMGSYQALIGVSPNSVRTGHYVQPITGKEDQLDALVCLDGDNETPYLSILSSDAVVGMPVNPAGSLTPALPAPPLGQTHSLMRPTGVAVGNFNISMMNPDLTKDTRLDDVVLLSQTMVSETNKISTATVMFREGASRAQAEYLSPAPVSYVGNNPFIAAVADFDRPLTEYDLLDLAVINHVTTNDEPFYEFALFRGLGNGSFSSKSISGDPLIPFKIGEDKRPVSIKGFPMRQTLGQYLDGVDSSVDVLIANAGFGDFTLFLNLGTGYFEKKSEGSRDFAVGGEPVDIAAHFLKSAVDGTAAIDSENDDMPDVVTLVKDNVVISYSVGKSGLQGDNSIGFDLPVRLGYPGTDPVAVALEDMNGDGYVDIAVLDRTGGCVWVYVNLAQRRFSEPFRFETGAGPVFMDIADMDADGCPDIVTADAEGLTITNLRNTAAACRKE